MADLAKTVDFLFGLRNSGSKYGLERMVRFAAAAGNPEEALAVVHVAGTNGKGSVCAMVESALRAAGHRTGLYTSPHLVHLGERIQIDRNPITGYEIVRRAGDLRRIAGKIAPEGSPEYPSFFEFMTLMAFQCFADERVDCAVIEVGLGGRLDATNIVNPAVTAISSIGLDHCEILGDTLGEIAGEKAGILKPGVPIVLGNLPGEGREVALDRASRLGCPVTEVASHFRDIALPATNLMGRFQRWNAGVAWLILQAIQEKFPVPDETIASAFQNVYWPGRWDVREVGGHQVILDCTHNPEGANELERNLLEQIGSPVGELDVVVGSLGLERAEAVLRVVAPYARKIYVVRPDQPRARSFAEMKAVVPAGFSGEVIESCVDEIFPGGDRIGLSPGMDPILVTGSLYLIGEVCSQIGSSDKAEVDRLQDRVSGSEYRCG